MRTIVLHNRVEADARPDDRDTLVQVEAVCGALASLGHEIARVTAGLDLEEIQDGLLAARPDVVVNLAETLAGTGRLVHVVPALLDHLGLPYTGSPADPMYLTSNKRIAKVWMRLHGLPVPDWADDADEALLGSLTGDRAIVKSIWEHSSIGLDEASVFDVRHEERRKEVLASCRAQLGGSAFVETYIDGREFNLSLVQRATGWQLLPPAEILFEGFAPDRPRIVGYRAKWVEESAEYRGTVRRFAFDESDGPLLAEMGDLALECCRVFGLRGYARVDFRVSEDGRPWILEVNANPCLSPDAGLAAAAQCSGIGYESLVGLLVDAAIETPRTCPETGCPHKEERSPGASRNPEHCSDEISPQRVEFTEGILPTDRRDVRDIVDDPGHFSSEEVEVAMEVFDEAIRSGRRSGYHFLVARVDGKPAGFSCFGPIPGTASRFDLYWIAVQQELRGRGIGGALLALSERGAREMGASHLQIDTSGKDAYQRTRRFYESMGYRVEAELLDFHGPGDAKVIYGKALVAGAERPRTPTVSAGRTLRTPSSTGASR